MPQLFSKVLANRVSVVQSADIHTTVVPTNPPQDVFVNTDSTLGIIKVFSRIHLHEDLQPAINGYRSGVHEADIVIVRASDGTLLGGAALDFKSPPINLTQESSLKTFVPISVETNFDWGDVAPSGIHQLVSEVDFVIPTPSYFLISAGDAVVTQLWLFSNTMSQFSIGWFAAIAYVKINPDGTLQ